MLSNARLNPVKHTITTDLVFFYSTERYETLVKRTLKKKAAPKKTISLKQAFAEEKRLARVEYKKMLMTSGYQPDCMSSDRSAEFAREFKRAGIPQPVARPGEVITFQGLLDDLSWNIEELIRERGHKLNYGVHVGEWPLGEFQASVTRTTSRNRAIVLVNSGLISLVYQMAKIMTYSLEFVHMDEDSDETIACKLLGWEPIGWTKQDSIEWIGKTLAAYVIHGDCRAGKRLPLSDSTRPTFATNLTFMAELFVVAHEYAHLLLEHVKAPKMVFATPYGDVEALGQNQRNEFDADLAAADLLIASANWGSDDPAGFVDVNFRVAGPCLFFVVAVFLEGVRIGPHDFTANKSGSHPAPYCRLTRILDHFHRRYGGSTNFLGEIFRQMIFPLVVPSVEKTQSLISAHNSTKGK